MSSFSRVTPADKEKLLSPFFPRELVKIIANYTSPDFDILRALIFDVVYPHYEEGYSRRFAFPEEKERLTTIKKILLKLGRNDLRFIDLAKVISKKEKIIYGEADGEYNSRLLFESDEWNSLWNYSFYSEGEEYPMSYSQGLNINEFYDFPLEKYFHLFYHPERSLCFNWKYFICTPKLNCLELAKFLKVNFEDLRKLKCKYRIFNVDHVIEVCSPIEQEIIRMIQMNPEKYNIVIDCQIIKSTNQIIWRR